MELFGANPVDVVVLVIIVVSALLALVRGFVAEVLSIVGWVAASFAVLYGLPYVQPTMEGYMGKGLTAIGASAGVLFIGTLAIMSAISYSVSRMMRKNNLSAVDRSLGFLFGFIRGGLLVSLLYICLTFIFPLPKAGEEVEPNTMQAVLLQARTQGALAAGANLLQSLAPDKTISIEDITESPLANIIQPRLAAPKPNTAAPAYGEPARNNLSSIIDRMSGDEAAQPEELPPEER